MQLTEDMGKKFKEVISLADRGYSLLIWDD